MQTQYVEAKLLDYFQMLVSWLVEVAVSIAVAVSDSSVHREQWSQVSARSAG